MDKNFSDRIFRTFVCLPLAGACVGCVRGNVAERPDIVFIFADDMGYGDVSCLNPDSKINTVRIDSLAGESVLFTDAHSSSSVSTPSRYSLLTGRYNWRSSMKQDVLFGYSEALIPEGRETVASMLKKCGYFTAAIGKWHLGWHWCGVEEGEDAVDFSRPVADGPSERGFDYFYGFSGSLDMPPFVYVENDMPTAVPDRISSSPASSGPVWWKTGPAAPDFVHGEALQILTSRACDVIKEKAGAGRPYFLYIPLPAPHAPMLPSETFKGKSDAGLYGDYVLMVDAMVGQILDTLRSTGRKDNTIVVFAADNGCAPVAGIGNLERMGHSPGYVFRGHKADLFEGGHRIPCMISWPGKIKAGTVDRTICLTDFYSTFASVAGYRPAATEGEDSFDMLPMLLSGNEDSFMRESTVHHSVNGQFAIRKGKWKLLLTASSGGWSWPRPDSPEDLDGLYPVQLYDLENDPSEKENLAEFHPDIVRDLKSSLLKCISDGRSTPGKPQKNDGEQEWRQLAEIRNII